MPEEIVVIGRKRKSLFSRWILMQSLLIAGLDKDTAFKVANDIRNDLLSSKIDKITTTELREVVENKLKLIDEKVAYRYKIFQDYRNMRDKGIIKDPLIILIGGVTGTGKTVVAAELAYRMNIKHIIGTDSIREILRIVLSRELLPTLHESTYEAWKHITMPLVSEDEKVRQGYLEQAKVVSAGIKAIVNRSLKEGLDIVVEGIHNLPSLLKCYKDRSNVITLVLTIKDENIHRSRLKTRIKSRRDPEKYMREFEKIRIINDFIIEQATIYGIPVVDNENLEKTLNYIIDRLIMPKIESIVKKTKPQVS